MTGLYIIVGIGLIVILCSLGLVWAGAWRCPKPQKGEGE